VPCSLAPAKTAVALITPTSAAKTRAEIAFFIAWFPLRRRLGVVMRLCQAVVVTPLRRG